MRNRTHKVASLREAKGWSMEMLGEKIGASTSTVNRIEKGETELVSEWVFKLAQAFEVSPQSVIGWEDCEAPNARDAEPFRPDRTHPLAGALAANRDLLSVTSPALDAIGIAPGAVVIVDTSQAAIDTIQTGDAVVIQIGECTCLRQFIEPDLFITNSRSNNGRPLNRLKQEVRIVGKIEHAVSPVRR